MRVLAIVFVVTCSIGFVTPSTQVSSCSSLPAPIQVNVGNCGTPPCEIVRDVLLQTIVQFTAVSDTDSLSATAVLSKDNKQLALLPINGLCNHLSKGSCPVKKGDVITISYTAKPLDIGNIDNVITEVTVTNNNSDVEFCFSVPLTFTMFLVSTRAQSERMKMAAMQGTFSLAFQTSGDTVGSGGTTTMISRKRREIQSLIVVFHNNG